MRPNDIARLALGAVVLARPGTSIRVVGGRDGEDVRRTVRLLGVRYLAQSLGSTWLRQRHPGHQRQVSVGNATVDLLHAALMLAVARVLPCRRRLALVSAAAATGFATRDLLAWRQDRRLEQIDPGGAGGGR
ncbi:hypothetical protein SAMN04487968_10917 [Nocardioides terrae]|uniref:Uncharacterized protein n=1 Tax=Nocardioides terrae TaxID=574651 RepID=A0A1I1KVR6_9ACTN|nr:hypothetical protein [Nocardioides terrae]SFC64372.1 hypothetical protein SAMN04487968_10917 [Nocardioides terrae]